jgi:hypothetical protein
MSDWSASIQAGAAVVQAVAAIIIYAVTREYVHLTRDIALAGKEQLKLTRLTQLSHEKQRANALRGRAISLEARVSALPVGPDDTALRRLPLWTFEEVEGLQSTAAEVNGLAADASGKAAVALVALRDQVQAIRAVPTNMGYDYAKHFREEEWRAHRTTALTAITELLSHAATAARLAEEEARQLSVATGAT